MKNKIYFGLLILLGSLFGLFITILFDIYKNNDVNTDIENFYISKNKILVYSMKSNWLYGTGININKQGFRDDDFDTKKGNVKILCFGDSTTFGGNVEKKSLYTNVLSELLSEKYSVYNFGIDGYNTIQEAENLRYNGIKYAPNIVVFLYCLNDFEICDLNIYYAAKSNFCRLNAFLCKSQIYRRFICLPTIKLIEFFRKEDEKNVVDIYRKYGEIDVSNIKNEEIGVKVVSELQKQYGFKCYFFILPYFRSFDNYLKEDEEIHNKIKEILQKYPNIKYFDLKEDFMNVSKDSSVFLYDDDDYVHPNEYGHELIAKFIYDKLKSDGALEDE
jgi:lysophospholipase L1-like esterase